MLNTYGQQFSHSIYQYCRNVFTRIINTTEILSKFEIFCNFSFRFRNIAVIFAQDLPRL